MQDSESTKNRLPLDKSQKIAIAVLVVFGFIIIVLWMVQFRKSLTEPFQYKGDAVSTTTQGQTASSSDGFNPSDPTLKTKDTDSDGLSDWDELNIYHSSPYLFSTAGDDVSDGVKVQKGEEPRCPENNQNCLASTDIATTTPALVSDQVATSTLGQASSSTSGFQPNLNVSTSTDEAGLQSMLTGQMDIKTLRKTSLESGMDPAMLNALSDEALMSIYQQVLNNNKTN